MFPGNITMVRVCKPDFPFLAQKSNFNGTDRISTVSMGLRISIGKFSTQIFVISQKLKHYIIIIKIPEDYIHLKIIEIHPILVNAKHKTILFY